MIRKLHGLVESIDVGSILVNVNGVVYEVYIPYRTYEKLKDEKKVSLHIFHSITERGQKLYGFVEDRERALFQFMKSLNGIGETTALRVMSYLGIDDLLRVIKEENRALLEKIPKIKGKTSEKIMFELKQNIKKFQDFFSYENENPDEEPGHELTVLALMKLGFDEKTARSEINKILKNKAIDDPAEIIKEVLKVT
ncbi:MAG: Holliday junction branch migration protein RuvA [Leptospiraceae bacterium]|nr:Holliday junction branch migration protein RuvA [Leptospiraceae bacterium]MCP5500147.1 Holliday junction branch migration protein RuvA [Leptospiraceae bacterium]